MVVERRNRPQEPQETGSHGIQPIRRINVLGVGVSAINPQLAVEIIERWIDAREHHYVCVTGVHGVMESQKNERLRKIHNQAGMVTPDGMPLVWLSRLQGFSSVRRVYGPDLMLALCARSATTGHRHYFYGGADGVPEQLASVLCETFPGIQIGGTFSPPFRPLSDEEKESVIHDIDRSEADIVWVGLGTPKQETWMSEFARHLQAPVLIGVGAAFDFLTGRKPQAPLWMQRMGLEWLFRLKSEPSRLWRRYLYNNPRFVLRITAQMLGWKRYSIE